MRKIQKICRQHGEKLLSKPNVIGFGIGYKEATGHRGNNNTVVVLVNKKVPPQKLTKKESIPQTIEGHETDVLETGDFYLLNRQNMIRPASPGASIGHYKISAGTFGAVVRDNKSGEYLILSNNHVLANSTNGIDGRAAPGDPILQPGPYDGGNVDEHTIGKLFKYIPIYRESEATGCPWAGRAERTINRAMKIFTDYRVNLLKLRNEENLADAAIAKPISPNVITPNIIELGPVKGVSEAKLGMRVTFSGRTSGIRESIIKVVNVTMRVNLSPLETAIFSDQIITKAMSAPGDSGSLVLNEKHNAIGLLFAGSDQFTACNRIQNILSLMDVSIVEEEDMAVPKAVSCHTSKLAAIR